MKLPPPLRASVIASTSPSQAESLRQCFLRCAFDASPLHRALTFKGPAARIGVACHALLEDVSRGRFDLVGDDQLPRELEQAWREHVNQQAEQAKESPLEQHLSSPRQWPYYALRKAFLFRLARDLIQRRHGYVASRAKHAHPNVTAERTYIGFAGRLRGRIDHVIEQQSHVEIEEYKSGAVVEPTSAGMILKEAYRRQLLLYAALHHEETGEWPALAHIVSLDCERLTIAIDPSDALAVASDTLALLDQYNRQVSSGTGEEDLARPGKQACQQCPYKAFCTPFWRAITPDWDLRDALYVAGEVAVVRPYGNSRVWDVDVRQGNLPSGRSRLHGLCLPRIPDMDYVKAGAAIRVLAAHARRTDLPFDLEIGDYTQLWWTTP